MHQHSPILEPDTALGDLAAARPDAARVLDRFGLDYCCGGRRTIREACAAAGLELGEVTAALAASASASPGESSWRDQPLAAVVEHIVAHYHTPLRSELTRLEALAKKVQGAHGERPGVRLAELASAVSRLSDELVQHLAKEEQVLFPWILSGRGHTAQSPVAVLQREHVETGDLLRHIRELTDGFVPPAVACGSWRALYSGLAELDQELRAHIHLENNVLFPGALAGSGKGG